MGQTWTLKKTQENKWEVAEKRILQQMCGVIKLDRMRNERIWATSKLVEEVSACNANIVLSTSCEGDGNRSTERIDCHVRKCTTEPHGGVYGNTSLVKAGLR